VDALLAGIASNAITACALACVVWFLFQTRFLRKRPAERYVLALVLLVKLVSPPLFAIPLPGFPDFRASDAGGSPIDKVLPLARASGLAAALDTPDMSREDAAGVNEFPVAQVPQTSSDNNRAYNLRAIAIVLFGGSLLGTTLIWFQLLWQWRRVRQALRFSSTPTGSVAALLADVCDRMACRQVPRLCVTGGRIPPMLWAGSRLPWIVLPRSLIEPDG
jgi:hypothetical protein